MHNRFGRLHENGSTEQEKAELTALPFFFDLIYVLNQYSEQLVLSAMYGTNFNP
jgi:hypothetical protein